MEAKKPTRRNEQARQAERLAPEIPALPQCEAGRVTKYHNDRPDTDRRCKGRARYKVAAASYCTRHAGVVALRILLGSAA
jgi:hypothetical protein